MEAWRSVKQSLEATGFSPRSGSGAGDRYVGFIEVGRVSVEIEIHISDYDFIDLPQIKILNEKDLPNELLAHTYVGGNLCYADKTTIVLDRYRPDRSVMLCLKQAKETLAVLIHGNPTEGLLQEFSAYWGGRCGYHFVDDAQGICKAVFGYCEFRGAPQIRIAAATEESASAWAADAQGKFVRFFTAPVMQIKTPLLPPRGRSLVLREMLDWLEESYADNTLTDSVISQSEPNPSLLIVAPNAMVGFCSKVPLLVEKARSGHGGFRSNSIAKLWRDQAANTEVEPFICMPASHKEIVERSVDGSAPLSERRIAIIGCGSVGGYIARGLIQGGAGGGGGELLLVDNDTLQPENIGRHILGARSFGLNKAEALASRMKSDFPTVRVGAATQPAQGLFSRLVGYDLVIDATGEQPVSEAINAHALSRLADEEKYPPVLFAMIFGNGTAGQTYLARWGKDQACYRCLKPDFRGDWRNNPIRPGAPETQLAARPCSLGAFVPYSVAAPIALSGLAIQQVFEFFSEQPSHDLHTVQIDYNNSRPIKPKNVKKSDRCIACGR